MIFRRNGIWKIHFYKKTKQSYLQENLFSDAKYAVCWLMAKLLTHCLENNDNYFYNKFKHYNQSLWFPNFQFKRYWNNLVIAEKSRGANLIKLLYTCYMYDIYTLLLQTPCKRDDILKKENVFEKVGLFRIKEGWTYLGAN